MKYALIACVLLTVAPAFAGDPATADGQMLDLTIPEAYHNDPPGTWYGDTSGVPASERRERSIASRCPASADGEPAAVTGSFTTGVGYGSHQGTSTWNAAHLNYCREYADDDGDARFLNISVNLGQYDGPDRYRTHPGPVPMARPHAVRRPGGH